MQDDPLEELLGELLNAHARVQKAQLPTPPPRRRRPRRRTLAISAAALALTASSATAIVLGTQTSAPLSGRLPKQLLGSRYALRVAPDLRAGHVAWCIALFDYGTRTSVLPDPSNCVTPTGALITRGGLATISPATGAVRGWLLYAIVDRRVRALRAPGGLRIRPVSSPQLPPDWRAAVTIRTDLPSSVTQSGVVTLTPLGAHGARLPVAPERLVSLPVQPVAPDAPSSGCRIGVRRAPGARALGARAVRGRVAPTPGVAVGYVSCYALMLDLDHHDGLAALLLDAARPGSRPAPLPGMRRLGTHPVIWVGAAATTVNAGEERLFAERRGEAWLVLQTSAPAPAAVALLAHMTAHS